MLGRRSATPRLSGSARRLLIEDAATDLFANRGFAATTVEEIVRAAGVTKPMLYRHFESKQELCIALLERHRDELVAAPLSVFDPQGENRAGQLVAMLRAWLGHTREHPAATRLLFIPITGDVGVERVQRGLYDRQRATLAALLCSLRPELSAAELELGAEATRASLAAVALWWLDHPEAPPDVPLRVLSNMIGGLIDVSRPDAGVGVV